VTTTFTQTGGTQLQKVSVSFTQYSTPEPATFALLGGGLLAFALFRRKVA
jgi:PEP-CTERM motif